MKIEENSPCELANLGSGDVFRSEGGDLCIVTDEFDDDECEIRLVVTLGCGTLLRFGQDTEVTPVPGARVVV